MADMVKNVLEKTELYLLFKKKSGDDDALRDAVKELCGEGEALSSQAYTFFPTFTRHDASHILGVCDWMYRLLKSMKKGKTSALDVLTAEEAALLLLAACWHDSGMAVSEAQKNKLLPNMDARKSDWQAYFKKHPGDEVALAEAKSDEEKTRERERILRNYVRERHAKRCKEQLPAEAKWKSALEARGVYRETVEAVCASHGEWMEELKLSNDNDDFDLRLCAVLLRLADLLDYDASRAPEALFRFLGLDRPETEERRISREEWNKNKTGEFRFIRDGKIYYHATFTDSQTEQGVKKYLDWLRHELDVCQSYLEQSELDRWRGFELPHQVRDTSKTKGIERGEFRITMDQDRVVELLSGSALYEHAGVFVRELLQNSIDAVLFRRKIDPSYVGHIVVRCWRDDEGWGWFRIEDDGVGMNERIIKDYFLRVGHSFYDSDEYRAASLHVARETGDKPTSRFGIGILSAFMTDPDNTVLQVSTRRYDEETPLRLDVTGLHGYYNLTRVTEERQGKPMSAPPNWHAPETELGRGVGTTICARVNLFRLGETSIRELLDQYVVFPEVRVTFYDETGVQKDYPTQKELMDAVHKLEGQELVCPLPSEMVKRMENKTRHFLRWTELPVLTLRLHPLDTLPDTEENQVVSGVALEAGFRGAAEYMALNYSNGTTEKQTVRLEARVNDGRKVIEMRMEDIEYQRLRLQIDALYNSGWWQSVVASRSYHFRRDSGYKMRWCKENGILLENVDQFLSHNAALFDDYERAAIRSKKVNFSFDEMLAFLSKCPKNGWSVLQDVLDVIQAVPKSFDIAAFNGVAVDRTDLMGKRNGCLGVVLLFRGMGRPTVNLARNAVTELSLDALCALSLVRENYSHIFKRIRNREQFALRPERDWFEVLERHPKWETRLRCGKRTLEEVEQIVRETGKYEFPAHSYERNIVFDWLVFAALKKRFQITRIVQKLQFIHSCVSKPSELPLPLFVRFKEEKRVLSVIRSDRINLYSETHPFSQWLLTQQTELRDKTPAIYHSILKTMVLGADKEEIRAALNDTLDRLAHLSGNHFGVTKDLYLTEQDFL